MTNIEPWPACWQPHQQELVVSEVGVQDDEVMLAVHEPPALRRRRVPLQGQLQQRRPEAEQPGGVAQPLP